MTSGRAHNCTLNEVLLTSQHRHSTFTFEGILTGIGGLFAIEIILLAIVCSIKKKFCESQKISGDAASLSGWENEPPNTVDKICEGVHAYKTMDSLL